MAVRTATHVTIAPADGNSVALLAAAHLQYAIAGWLRSEPLLLVNSPVNLPLLPAGSAVIKAIKPDTVLPSPVLITPETRVDVSYVPLICALPTGQTSEALVELLTLTMNGCSLGPPGSFFHTPSSLLVHLLIAMFLTRLFQLHGPAGVGKTHLVRSICGALKLNFFPISIIYLLSLQDPCEPLTRIFATVRKHWPAVVLLEDLDCTNVIEETSLLTTALPPLLSGLAALLEQPRIFVVGELRDVDHLPTVLKSAPWLSRRLEVPLPSPTERATLLAEFIGSSSIDADNIRAVAYRSAGFLPLDLQRLASHSRTLAGSNSVSLEHLMLARTQLPPSQLADYLPPQSDVTWNDVGGSVEIRRAFQEAFEWPTQHAADLARLGVVAPSGLLLYGPSGCGKTLSVHALANGIALNFLTVKGPELFSKYLGDTERTVRRLFARARKMAPCIVFVDELDAIGARRVGGDDGESGVSERVLTQLLTEMDGIADKKKVTVIGCTNRPDLIDSALLRPGRLDAHVYVAPPDQEARLDILRVISRRTPLHASVDLSALSIQIEGYSGADIASLIREAAIEAQESVISDAHLKRALERVEASITTEDLQRFEQFKQATSKR